MILGLKLCSGISPTDRAVIVDKGDMKPFFDAPGAAFVLWLLHCMPMFGCVLRPEIVRPFSQKGVDGTAFLVLIYDWLSEFTLHRG